MTREKGFGYECLLENIMVSNGNEDGSEIDAAADVKRQLDAAESVGGVTTVDCVRCDTSFSVLSTGAVVLQSKKDCDRPTFTPSQGHVLNINMERLSRNAAQAA